MDRMRRSRKTRSVNAHAAKAAKGGRPAPKPAPAAPAHQRGRVVPLAVTPERMLERAARKFISGPADNCDKCGSTFIVREPAFIHCHYCGKMARIANASLGAQELFELRLGLRLAS
jgi:hypothetical protein